MHLSINISNYDVLGNSRMSRSFLIRVWISFILALILPYVFSTPEDDKEFMDLYGMDEFTPGHWECLRDFQEDMPKLRRLSQRAHNTSGTQPPGKVYEVGFCQKKLHFHNSTGYRPLELDVLLYTIKGHMKSEYWPYFFYIGKGLDPGCVYYLKPIDDEAKGLMLDRHVCNINMTNIFEWPKEEINS